VVWSAGRQRQAAIRRRRSKTTTPSRSSRQDEHFSLLHRRSNRTLNGSKTRSKVRDLGFSNLDPASFWPFPATPSVPMVPLITHDIPRPSSFLASAKNGGGGDAAPSPRFSGEKPATLLFSSRPTTTEVVGVLVAHGSDTGGPRWRRK
jgi:hypothetical protein